MAAKKTKLIKIEKEFNLIGNHVAVGDEVEINYKYLRIKQFSYRGKKLYSTSEFNFTKGVPIHLEGFESVTFEDASNLVIESQI